MRELVPTLTSLVAQADRAFSDGRVAAARRAYEDLVQRAQDKHDRGTEVIARSMLARCLLRMQQRDEARSELSFVARVVDRGHPAYSRYRGALVRLAVDEGPPETTRRELVDYLRWGEETRSVEVLLDAAGLLSAALPPRERADHLERVIDLVGALDPEADLASAYVEWGSALDALGETEAALRAWTHALQGHSEQGRGRPTVAAGWAAGAAACRLEDWPLARGLLEEAIALGEGLADCEDLVALALADLSQVYEEAGDVVEARRLVLRALKKGREHHLASAWPERWAALHEQAKRLEVE